MRLYDTYKDSKPWDENIPADLHPAIKHLRKQFGTDHWQYGRVTQILCNFLLHPNIADSEEMKAHLKPLSELKQIVGREATTRFVELLKMENPSAIFKAFLDLYLDSLTLAALGIFSELVSIGRVNEDRLNTPHLEWAEEQTKNLIRSQMHSIEIWVRNV